MPSYNLQNMYAFNHESLCIRLEPNEDATDQSQHDMTTVLYKPRRTEKKSQIIYNKIKLSSIILV